MLSTKVFKEHPPMRAVIDEVDERFIIGLDPKVLTDSKMIFFKIQKAYWYYKDHFERLIKERKIPSLSLEVFGQILIEGSHVLSRIYPHELRELKFREWQDYLRRVPRLGAICINPSMDKVLMIQPFGKNRKCLQFPRGKLHAGEEHQRAAAREVWEEVGIRIENLINPNEFFEHYIDSTLHKLYIVFPVMEELVPTIQCNKEIEQILWFPISQLPGWSSKISFDDRGFFGVSPFVLNIKSFIKARKQTEVGSIKILKRLMAVGSSMKQALLDESIDPEDQEADRYNKETFGGEETQTGWSVDDMLNANSRLGVKSTYDEASFGQIYSTGSMKKPITENRLLDAFMIGWDSCS
jgi:8-oxo-dGTP pyrophosphatase MutT (NUDIX family)